MNKIIILLILNLCNVKLFASGVFPSNIEKCHYHESECLRKQAKFVMEKYAKTGLKELNLIKFDPLHVKSLKLERNANSPVNIELRFNDIDFLGFSNANFQKIEGFSEDLNSMIKVELIMPEIILRGPYQIDGNVLILPIVGKGNCNIKLDDVSLRFKTKKHGVVRDGKEYIAIDTVKLEIRPKRVHFELTGLFNGNKALSDNMLVFMNENWKDIFDELEPSIAEAIALILKQIFSNVFNKHPYEDFFLKTE